MSTVLYCRRCGTPQMKENLHRCRHCGDLGFRTEPPDVAARIYKLTPTDVLYLRHLGITSDTEDLEVT